jgi:hypothetical protein
MERQGAWSLSRWVAKQQSSKAAKQQLLLEEDAYDGGL